MSSITYPGALPTVPPGLHPTISPPRGGTVVLSGIRWESHGAILKDLGAHAGNRLTFDRGRLQIMSPLPEHERFAEVLGLFVRAVAAEAQMRLAGYRMHSTHAHLCCSRGPGGMALRW